MRGSLEQEQGGRGFQKGQFPGILCECEAILCLYRRFEQAAALILRAEEPGA